MAAKIMCCYNITNARRLPRGVTFYNKLFYWFRGIRVPDLKGGGLAAAVSYKTLTHFTTAVSPSAAGRSAGSKGSSDS